MVTCKSRRGIPLEQPELAEHKLNSKVITVLAFACHILSPWASYKSFIYTIYTVGDLSQIMFALRVGRWSEKRVVYYIKSAN